jgi:hypothetical protein
VEAIERILRNSSFEASGSGLRHLAFVSRREAFEAFAPARREFEEHDESANRNDAPSKRGRT